MIDGEDPGHADGLVVDVSSYFVEISFSVSGTICLIDILLVSLDVILVLLDVVLLLDSPSSLALVLAPRTPRCY